jgi:large subunit ribosomal protein L24
MKKIRKGDLVEVLTGRDKGKRGTVLSRVDDNHLVVDGVNVVKKATKPNPAKGMVGGFISKSLKIHQSNLAVVNPSTGKTERVGVKLVKNLVNNKVTRVRVFKSSGMELAS